MKEPWRMTKEEYFSEVQNPRFQELMKAEREKTDEILNLSFESANPRLLDRANKELEKINKEKNALSRFNQHKKVTQRALSEGKPVPPEVLADYPDLKPEAVCVHRWDIEPAQGETSQGVCVKCGKVREFQNFFDVDWKTNRDFRKSEEDDYFLSRRHSRKS